MQTPVRAGMSSVIFPQPGLPIAMLVCVCVCRCGGQGDLLSGAIAVYWNWCLMALDGYDYESSVAACVCACDMVKQAAATGYREMGRALLASDIIPILAAASNRKIQQMAACELQDTVNDGV